MTNDIFDNFKNEDNDGIIELNRQKWGIFAFCIIGGSPTVYYSLFSETVYPFYVHFILIISTIFLFSIGISLFFHKKYQLCTLLCSICITPPIVTLVASGGYLNTGLYWVFPYSIALYMFLGHIKGVLISCLLWALFCVMFYVPSLGLVSAEYTEAETGRFLASYLISIFLGFSSEIFRFRSFNKLALLTNQKDQLANTDPLTSLPNRRFIDSVFLEKVSANPAAYLPLALILTDIDNFKMINDTYGHSIGDDVLQHTSSSFRNSLRASDIVARIGGEEFLTLLPKANLTNAVRISEKIRANIEQDTYINKHVSIDITISSGVAILESIAQFDAILALADSLMYQAKAKGKNRSEFVAD